MAEDFPSLFRSSDREARQQQQRYMWLLKINLGSLVTAGAMSLIVEVSPWFAFLQGAMLLIALFSIFGLYMLQPQRRWYRLRALAESVKTASWRYMMRAAPYDGADLDADRAFSQCLRKIYSSNMVISRVPRNESVTNWYQMTKKMKEIRNLSIQDRKKFYMQYRIEDQNTWYRKKSLENTRRNTAWSIALCILVFIAIACAFLRIIDIDKFHWLVDLLVVSASSIFAWIQAGRYQELAASYALAAHEIGLLVVASEHISEEGAFSEFVGDAENAFSREHTQWQARRDAKPLELAPS